jgi:glycosyltransferase involved in cell wall biosynthesis
MKAGGIKAVPRGIGRLAKALFKRDAESLLVAPSPPSPQTTKTILVPGLMVSTPAISILIPQDEPVIRPDEKAIQEWLSGQTYSDVDIVIWDREAQRAIITGEAGKTWKAPDMPAVISGLRTEYLCVASYDLLQQNSTYLETNLIALKSESLAFTVNLRGPAEWALNCLREGRLPGSSEEPLLRQFAAIEAIRDGSLDLSGWIDRHKGSPGVIGKVIRHTTNEYDAENTLPFNLPMPAAETTILDRNIFERSNPGIPWEVAAQALHPVETVLPTEETPSELPTVIVVMTFLAVGGAEQIALKVMQKLQDQFRFVVVAFEELDPELGTTADAFRQITPYVYTLPDYLNESLNASFMDRLIKRFKPRTIYIANGATWIFNALGEIKNRYPELRIANQVYDSEVGWINRYDISLILHIDAHIGVNSKICQAYMDKGARLEQTYLIENGIDSSEITPADYSGQKIAMLKKQFSLPEGKKIVTFASRIHPQKRPIDFVELARRFSSDPSVVFFMVGDGPLAKQVQEEIEKIGLKNIFRHPFYRPISDVLAVSDVFVLPSEFEGMPMIIIEAQAMGKPVVVTDVGNNREVIAKTGGGVVVSQIGDVAALRAGVVQMLENPPDPERLRQATLSHYDISIVAEKYRNAWLGTTDA